jgi:hypothetical protein
MSKLNSLVVVSIFAISLLAQQSQARYEACDILPGALATAGGLVCLGLGSMFAVFTAQEDQKTRAQYNTTSLVVSNYTVTQDQCPVCGKGCTYYPYTAWIENTYQTYFSGTLANRGVRWGSRCGNTPDEALSYAQKSSPLGSTNPNTFFYLIADPGQLKKDLPTSSYIAGVAVFFGLGIVPIIAGPIVLVRALQRGALPQPSPLT